MNNSNHQTEKVVGFLSSILFGVSTGALLGLITGFLIGLVQGSIPNSALIPLILLVVGSIIGGLLGFRVEKKSYDLMLLDQKLQFLKQQDADSRRKQIIASLAKSFVNEGTKLTDADMDKVHQELVRQVYTRIEKGDRLGFIRMLSEDTMEINVLELPIDEGSNGGNSHTLKFSILADSQYSRI